MIQWIALLGWMMALQTIVELEFSGRGQGWTDVSADLGDQSIDIQHGIRGNGIADRVASAGTAKFELVNQNPTGKYSPRHTNKVSGFGLGIGVRIRLILTTPQGTGTGYLIDNLGGYAADETTVALDTGTGTIWPGDIVTFDGVAGEYIVESVETDPSDSITFQPGLVEAVADDAAVTLIGRNFTRFRGRIDSIDPAPGIFERRTVHIEAVDWMDDAARAKVSGIPVQLQKRADEIFEELIASVPFEPDGLEIDESPDTYAYAMDSAQDEKSTVLSQLQKLALSEFGLIYQKADGTVVFESRTRRATSEGIVETFADVSALTGFASSVARDDAPSRVQMITHPRKVDASNESVLFRLDNPLQIGAKSSVTILGPYRDPNQEAERVGGTDMQTPVAYTDYEANSQSDGGGTDVTGNVTLTPSFGGNGARVLIANNGSSTAWLTLLQLRGRGIYDYQNIVLEAEDEDAQINVGTTVSADMPFQDNAALGAELALWILNLYSDIENLAESATVFIPRYDEALADRVLSREISDRIDIVEQMTGFEAEETGGHFIQNVSLTIDARDNVSVTWGLAPANRQQFWLLEIPGRSELDETAVLGFGLVVGHTDVSHADTHSDSDHADVPHTDEHGDEHSDSAHIDTEHTDTHEDTAHADTAHVDDHEDLAHTDVNHRDRHSDVAYVDTPHIDSPHVDAHGDVPHNDYTQQEAPYEHYDEAHIDAHTDINYTDVHTDSAHSDTHNDVLHQDVAHEDEHDDVAHADTLHGDTHGDGEHGDAEHGDGAHTDSHVDFYHQDTPHGDDHADTEHGDQN